MSVTYQLKTKDILNATLRVFIRTPVIWVALAAWLALVASKFWVIALISQEISSAEPLFWLAVFMPFFVSALWVYRASLTAAKTLPVTVTLTEEGVAAENANGRSLTKWSVVKRVIRTNRHVFLDLESKGAFVIPRWAFLDDGEWETFYHRCEELKAAFGKRSQA